MVLSWLMSLDEAERYLMASWTEIKYLFPTMQSASSCLYAFSPLHAINEKAIMKIKEINIMLRFILLLLFCILHR